METFLALVTLAAIVALAVGIIWPRVVFPWRGQASRSRVALVYGGTLVGALVLVAIFVDLPDPEPRPTPVAAAESAPEVDHRELQVRARVSGGQVHVTNASAVDWTDCTVAINAGVVRSGWTQVVGRIPAGESVSGGLLAFTRSGGERFNPATHQVEDLKVECRTPSGRGLWMGAL